MTSPVKSAECATIVCRTPRLNLKVKEMRWRGYTVSKIESDGKSTKVTFERSKWCITKFTHSDIGKACTHPA